MSPGILANAEMLRSHDRSSDKLQRIPQVVRASDSALLGTAGGLLRLAHSMVTNSWNMSIRAGVCDPHGLLALQTLRLFDLSELATHDADVPPFRNRQTRRSPCNDPTMFLRPALCFEKWCVDSL